MKIPSVRHLVAVASGKGGVGKTTVTVNLALALQRDGARVGIFDADIYGPNVPLMLGVRRKKSGRGFVPIVRRANAAPYVDPLERFGLQVMSTGLLIGEDQAINPPAGTAGQVVLQTLRDVKWDRLDYLLLDLPPSAGEPQETLVSRLALDGVLIVTTPQDLSLLDAARSLRHFADNQVPILGVVENMSYFICPDCGSRHEIFQRSERVRPELLRQAPLLGRIPLEPAVSRGINRANPLMHAEPEGVHAEAFMAVAREMAARLNNLPSHSAGAGSAE